MDGQTASITSHPGYAPRDQRVNAALPTTVSLMTMALIAVALAAAPHGARAADPAPLELEMKIPLGDVKGRIDHLAFDSKRRRLLVAELGNGTVASVDLAGQKASHIVSGLKEPQGVAYLPSRDTIYIASGGDGSVQLLRAGDYSDIGRVDLGDDADNVRVDIPANRVFVGYGSGALAIIDPTARSKIADIPLRAHPESFQLARGSNTIFVNLPRTHEIALVDRAAGKQIAAWPMNGGGNFAMALDDDAQRVLVVFRDPPSLAVFSMRQGEAVARQDVCRDADDMFLDAKRHRLYVSCGEGFLDVFDAQGDAYRRVGHVPTADGARTSLFIPNLDRLALAVPARAGQPAEVWLYRPAPE